MFVVRNDAEIFAIKWGVPVAIAFLAIGVRLLFSANKLTVIGIARGVIVGLFVGSVVNLYLIDIPEIRDGMRGAIVGVSVILAEDLIQAVFVLGKSIRNNPEQLFSIIFRKGGGRNDS